MTDQSTVAMVAPDGKTVGDVPVARQAELLTKGFTLVAQPTDNYQPAPPLGTIAPEIQDLTHEGKTPLIHIKSSRVGDVPMAKVPELLKTKEFRLPSAEELQSMQDEADINKRAAELEKDGTYTAGIGGAGGAFLAGLAKGAPGYQIAKAIADHDAAGNRTVQIERAAEEKYEAGHPVAELAGRVPSELASAYAIGAIGAAGTGAVGLTGRAATLVQGAFYGLEPATANVIAHQDNPKDAAIGAAEDLALGAIGNVALHGLFEYAGKGIKSILGTAETKWNAAPIAEEVEKKQQQAVNTIAKTLGVTPAGVEKAAKVIPKLIDSKVLERTDTLETAIKKVQALEESGEQIGKAIEKLDGTTGKGSIIGNELSKAFQKVSQLGGEEWLEREKLKSQLPVAQAEAREAKSAFELADEAMGKELKQATVEELQNPEWVQNLENQYNVIKEHATMTENVVNGIKATLKEKMSPSSRQAEKALRPILEEINAAAKKGTFQDTQALKKFIGQQTNWNADNAFANDLRRQAYNLVRESVINAEDEAAKALGNPEVVQSLQQNRAQYAWHKIMETFVDKTAHKEVMQSSLEKLSHMPAGRHGLWGVLGHALLGPLGSLGGVATSLGVSALKKYTKNHAIGVAVGAYQDAAGLVAKASQHQENKIFKAVKDTMQFMSSAKKEGVRTTGAAIGRHGVNNWLPDNGVGKSHKQQLDALRSAVQIANSHPGAVADHLATVTAPLHHEELHDVASAYTNHQLRLLKVLQVILPQDPTMASAHPFSQNVEAEDISPATKTKYERALHVAYKPEVLLEMVKNHTITPLDVAIAAATNPMTLQRMRQAMLDEALKSKPDLTYQHQLAVGILMGTNLDQSTTQLPVLQSVYIPVQPVTPGNTAKGGGKKASLNAKSQDNIDESVMTTSQKAANI